MNVEPEESEISLLDLLLVVAENIKLLVLGPMLVGLLALGVSYSLPNSYVSQAVIASPNPPVPTATTTPTVTTPTYTPQQTATLMTQPVVFEAAAALYNPPLPVAGRVTGMALASRTKVTVGKDGLLRVDVAAPTPEQAHALAVALIDAWQKSTVPVGQARQDLEKRLLVAKTGLETSTALLRKLAATGSTQQDQMTRGATSTNFIAISELQARYIADEIAIFQALQGVPHDVVKQPPTLPTEPVPRKKSLIGVLAALGSGFVLLFFVFMRQAWKNAAADPEAALKQSQLKRALGFKSK